MDKDRKIEIQQKLIEQLTQENVELKEKLLSEESKSEDIKNVYENTIRDMEQSKQRYDKLIRELEELKEKYRVTYNMYRKLTE